MVKSVLIKWKKMRVRKWEEGKVFREREIRNEGGSQRNIIDYEDDRFLKFVASFSFFIYKIKLSIIFLFSLFF